MIMVEFIKNSCLTMRAPDWWESARFEQFPEPEAGSVKAALSRPAHQRVTQTVSPPEVELRGKSI